MKVIITLRPKVLLIVVWNRNAELTDFELAVIVWRKGHNHHHITWQWVLAYMCLKMAAEHHWVNPWIKRTHHISRAASWWKDVYETWLYTQVSSWIYYIGNSLGSNKVQESIWDQFERRLYRIMISKSCFFFVDKKATFIKCLQTYAKLFQHHALSWFIPW